MVCTCFLSMIINTRLCGLIQTHRITHSNWYQSSRSWELCICCPVTVCRVRHCSATAQLRLCTVQQPYKHWSSHTKHCSFVQSMLIRIRVLICASLFTNPALFIRTDTVHFYGRCSSVPECYLFINTILFIRAFTFHLYGVLFIHVVYPSCLLLLFYNGQD